MKRFLTKPIIWAAGCLVALTFCACGNNEIENVDLKLIQSRQLLKAAEFNFHKIIVERSTISAVGFAGHGIVDFKERILVLPVDVQIAGMIDFSGVTKDNLISTDDGLVFILPDPILHFELNADREMRGYASKEGILYGGTFSNEEIKQIQNQAIDSIMIERTLTLMAEQTRTNAASIMIPLVALATGMPEEKIIVQFNSELNLSAAMLKEDKRTIIFRRKE